MNTEKTSLIVNENVGDVKVEPKEKKQEGKAGVLSSIFNLTNTVIGVGVLAYPYAYYNTGLVMGIIFTILIVALTGVSLMVLAYAASLDDEAQSYQSIIRLHMGEFWVKFSEIMFIINLTGACMTFLIIIGDCITPFFTHFCGEEFFFSSRVVVIIFVSCLIVFPLIFLRNLNSLGFTSFIAVGSVTYLMILLIVYAIYGWANGEPLKEEILKDLLVLNVDLFGGWMPRAFLSVPIIAFSFQGIELIAVPIYFELKNKSLWKMLIIIGSSLTLSCFFYIIIGSIGLLKFGNDTKSNILISFPSEFIPAYVARLLLGLCVTLSYPLYIFAERLAVHSLINPKKKRIGTWEFFFVTIIGFLVAMIIPMFVTDLSDVIGIFGSIGAIVFIFVFPSIILIKIVHKNKTLKMWQKIIIYILSVIMIIIASILAVAGNVVTIVKIVVEYQEGKK